MTQGGSALRIFLSFHSKDHALAQALREGLLGLEPTADIFLSSVSLRSGFWVPKLAKEISAADAFLLLIGRAGVGPWQQLEYDEALARHVNEGDRFPLVPLIIAGAQAPGFPFLRRLNWVEAPVVPDGAALHRLFAALKGESVTSTTPLWKLVNPYRGLEAMTEANTDYFYGRENETTTVLKALAEKRGRCPILVGASGVGKSSVARAGVLSALKSRRWPGTAGSWPAGLNNSHRWLPLVVRPGEKPLEALAASFIQVWQLDPGIPDHAALPRQWAEGLTSGQNKIVDLIEATYAKLKEKDGDAPERIIIYVDQGEELYTRAISKEAQRFSEVIAEGLADNRFSAFASLRADYFDRLQADRVLFACREHIDVAPLDRTGLSAVVTSPAKVLEVEFEDDLSAERIISAAAAEPGALPLLSYLLHDMWAEMTKRADHILRLPARAIDVGGALASRAEEFLKQNPHQESSIRRLLTLKLCTVPPEGEPMRRRTRRPECTPNEWDLACSLADYPWRLVVTSESIEDGQVIAEVAHEALLRAWPRLAGWLREERNFLIFKNEVEKAQKRWESVSKIDNALLGGLDLARAEEWLPKRPNDLTSVVVDYIKRSIAADRARKQRQLRFQRYVSVGAGAAALILAIIGGIAWFQWGEAEHQRGRANAELVKAQEAQSMLLADVAQKTIAERDLTAAMLLAMAGLPDSSSSTARSRPYVSEAEGALRRAYLDSQERLLFAGHSGTINSIATSSDGKSIFTGSADATIRTWDARTGSQRQAISEPGGPVRALAVNGEGTRLVTGSDDDLARIWDTGTGRQILTMKGHLGPVTSVAISRDGTRVITGSEDYTVRVWDGTTGVLIKKLAGHRASISSVAISSDGRRVVSGSSDGTARIWDADTGAELRVLDGHELPITGVAISPDDRRIVAGSYDKNVYAWDAATGELTFVMKGHEAPVTSVALSPDGTRIITGSEDKTVRLWDAFNGHELFVLRGHADRVTSVTFNPDGTQIVTGSSDGTARIWAVDPMKDTTRLREHRAANSSAAFSGNGKLLVTGSSDNAARVWDVSSGLSSQLLDAHTQPVSAVAINLDGSRIVTASWDGSTIIWDTAKGQVIRTLIHNAGRPVTSVALSPDGSHVATGGGEDDKNIKLWDASSGQELITIQGLAGRVTSLFIMSRNNRIISAAGTSVRIWSATTGEQIKALLGHTNSVLTFALNADATRIVTGARDMTAILWDLESGKRLQTLRGHSGAVTSVAISADGARVFTGSSDNSVRLWEAATGKEIATIANHSTPVTTMALSPDGQHIVTASSGDDMLLSRVFLTPQSLIDHVKRYAPRCLSLPQLIQYHLSLEPPRWCIAGAGHENEASGDNWQPKWPYQSERWRQWLLAKDAGHPAQLPDQ
jgi:WD40 repeat protein